ncbi:hypothetical protein CRUP_011728, partial [Coryphaenoides rupestris]
MFPLRFGVTRAAASSSRVASRCGYHKLASVQSASRLPEHKFKGLLYPFSVLDPYLDRSVDRTHFQLFQPSLEDVVKAEQLFSPRRSNRID